MSDQDQNPKVVQSQETEIVIYAKIGNPSGLNEATAIEEHLQIEGKFSSGNRCRVRKTTYQGGERDGEDEYVFTIKEKTEDDSGVVSNIEHNVPVNEEFLNAFTKNAERKIQKTRYSFTSHEVLLKTEDGYESIPNVLYEVDVYDKADGSGKSEWAKIDVEINTIINYIKENHPEMEEFKYTIKISHLPFAPQSGIISMNATEEEKAIIDNLWNNEYVMKLREEGEETPETPDPDAENAQVDPPEAGEGDDTPDGNT